MFPTIKGVKQISWLKLNSNSVCVGLGLITDHPMVLHHAKAAALPRTNQKLAYLSVEEHKGPKAINRDILALIRLLPCPCLCCQITPKSYDRTPGSAAARPARCPTKIRIMYMATPGAALDRESLDSCCRSRMHWKSWTCRGQSGKFPVRLLRSVLYNETGYWNETSISLPTKFSFSVYKIERKKNTKTRPVVFPRI